MLVILDRQHGQKSASRPFDPGATFGALRETDLTAAYIAAAADELHARGHEVVLLDSGSYDARHVEANARAHRSTGRVAYIAAHVNAGEGSYALVEYDARSIRGAALADAIAFELRTLPGITKSLTKGLGQGERGFVCIDGVFTGRATAALVEPGFIDSGSHAHLWTPDGLRAIGKRIASAVEAWGA